MWFYCANCVNYLIENSIGIIYIRGNNFLIEIFSVVNLKKKTNALIDTDKMNGKLITFSIHCPAKTTVCLKRIFVRIKLLNMNYYKGIELFSEF